MTIFGGLYAGGCFTSSGVETTSIELFLWLERVIRFTRAGGSSTGSGEWYTGSGVNTIWRRLYGVFTGVFSRNYFGEIGARKLFTLGCILTVILLANLRYGVAGVMGFLNMACTLSVDRGETC